ncbi:MAG: CopG family ribbon-helix-helix protein [Acidobacteriia bacterium]|nr:CopG family ribbon-helix-helix protein [Terriglobia bacterium]
MDKQTVSFRLDSDKVSTLDTLAEALDRDRSYLLNEAVAAYLKVQEWQIEQIKEGLRQANRGKLVDHARVTKMAAGWRRHR